jgi:hypothetical protein
MKTMLLASAVLMMTAAAPVFAADAPAKPATPAPAAASPASPTPAAAPAKPVAAAPMTAKHAPKMVHKAKMMPMKKGMTAPMHPAKEATTDQLNQQQLDTLKK